MLLLVPRRHPATIGEAVSAAKRSGGEWTRSPSSPKPKRWKPQAKAAKLATTRKTCSARVAVALDRVLVMGSLKGETGGPVIDGTIGLWRAFIVAHPTQTRFMAAVVDLLEAAQADARS